MRPFSMQDGMEHLEIRNTGLRPNWNSFWALESTGSSESEAPRIVHPSFISMKSGISGGTTTIRHVRLITGSEWIGEWDHTGMTGIGMYKMPHGVIYEGTMKSGLFEGIGVLKYPNGSYLEGLWYRGKLKYWQYDYADGLERDCQNWTYCSMPDRRFHSEHIGGFRPAKAEQLANDYPARDVPPGHYDVGQGFYNPKSHCVVDAITGEVLSIPTADEEKWILERCRSSEPIETVGFRPDLYENLFKKSKEQTELSESMHEDSRRRSEIGDRFVRDSYNTELTEHELWENSEDAQAVSTENTEKEILSLIKQEGSKLQPLNKPLVSRKRHSLHEKLEVNKCSDQYQERYLEASFEGLCKKILKEIEFHKHSVKISDDSGTKIDSVNSDNNFLKLTQMISAYAETGGRKKTGSSSVGSLGALEQLDHVMQ